MFHTVKFGGTDYTKLGDLAGDQKRGFSGFDVKGCPG